MRNFKELQIWQLGMEIVKEVYSIAYKLPEEEKYELRLQITRSDTSFPSNIAEGCSRHSNVDFKRFLEIALGSLYELQTQLILIKELNLVKLQECDSINNNIENECKMINSFIAKLNQFR